jgi:uncharacterized protein
MRYDDLRASSNIEDRRGMGGFTKGGLGIGAIAILTLIGYATGIDPRILIGGAEMVAGGGSQDVSPQGQQGVPTDQEGGFVARVLGETEDVWTAVLPQQTGVQYQAPELVLYTGITQSGCGTAQSAMGPFYCPVDRKVYLDTAFFHDMETKLGGGGAFPDAYVIAHEIGHHVQNLTGVLPTVQRYEAQAPDQATANQYSVRTELNADCLAGVWAYYMNQRHANITDNDVRQAVATASAIGDDRLQRASRGTVVPDSFTHGTSQQRVEWLTTGLQSGQIKDCNRVWRSLDPGQ